MIFNDAFWSETHQISRLIHYLLPSTSNFSTLLVQLRGVRELQHLFFQCSKNGTAGQEAILRVIRCYD